MSIEKGGCINGLEFSEAGGTFYPLISLSITTISIEAYTKVSVALLLLSILVSVFTINVERVVNVGDAVPLPCPDQQTVSLLSQYNNPLALQTLYTKQTSSTATTLASTALLVLALQKLAKRCSTLDEPPYHSTLQNLPLQRLQDDASRVMNLQKVTL